MSDAYLIIVIILFVLAILDLVVGVSNDAVNFLNSAIGSKVAKRNVIMIVASLGILIGATFSSGMMEVARKGIFNPEYFFFAEIMIIFIAVMITDIILLDLFNTFGMPTSTTVSIVFELLGAAVAVSILKITAAGEPLSTISNYINTSSALLIISGIFISILIAFLIGTIVQYFSRILFTFHIQKRMAWIGGIWSGLALAALTYFLLIKGIKGASFISESFMNWVKQNTFLLLGLSFVFWSIVMQVCISIFKLNILRFVVLFGTFALAMAFAGNDLVNFIGVPIAGLESFWAWSGSGIGADAYGMSVLNEPVRTQTYLLVGAGLIMVTTLWFSKKARSVTETEVNLGRQSEGTERFSPNWMSKGIVRFSLVARKEFNKLLPVTFQQKIEENFRPNKHKAQSVTSDDPPAFDLVRASVNLTIASMLIAFATSLKLPLSTTYVSFMVAMGTSLADRAWGRSSAVFRIAGVLNVIGGWFFTAFMAFTAAAAFATIIHFFGIWGIGSLFLLALFLISRTYLMHSRKEKRKASQKELEKHMSQLTTAEIIRETTERVSSTLDLINKGYRYAIHGLIVEDRPLLKRSKKKMHLLKEENEVLFHQMYHLIKRIKEINGEASRVYVLFCDLAQDTIQSITKIVDICEEYIDHSLDPITAVESKPLLKFSQILEPYLNDLSVAIQQFQLKEVKKILKQKNDILMNLEEQLGHQVEDIKKDTIGLRKSQLFMSILLETKDLVEGAASFAKLYRRVQKLNKKQDQMLIADVEEEVAYP
jgi:phosphate/sulfate permease